jgi:hypothetical protein
MSVDYGVKCVKAVLGLLPLDSLKDERALLEIEFRRCTPVILGNRPFKILGAVNNMILDF